MPEAKTTKTEAAAVPGAGEPDRVAMPRLRSDGTLDPNQELIGDPDEAAGGVREQYRQAAVSAADVRARSGNAEPTAIVGDKTVPVSETKQDPAIEQLQKEHADAAAAGESAADEAVLALHKGK